VWSADLSTPIFVVIHWAIAIQKSSVQDKKSFKNCNYSACVVARGAHHYTS
jgi:hypothetical protein